LPFLTDILRVQEVAEMEGVRQGSDAKADGGAGGMAISNKFEQLWGDEQEESPAPLVSTPCNPCEGICQASIREVYALTREHNKNLLNQQHHRVFSQLAFWRGEQLNRSIFRIGGPLCII